MHTTTYYNYMFTDECLPDDNKLQFSSFDLPWKNILNKILFQTVKSTSALSRNVVIVNQIWY